MWQFLRVETLLPHTLVIGGLSPADSSLRAFPHTERLTALSCRWRNGIQIIRALVPHVIGSLRIMTRVFTIFLRRLLFDDRRMHLDEHLKVLFVFEPWLQHLRQNLSFTFDAIF